jgi:glycosyltransferase involved in cell wall biosynthesis
LYTLITTEIFAIAAYDLRMVTRSSGEPLVSVIIPVYNRARMVREAVDSVLAVARDLPLEIVVVDDASTDDTWESLQAYGEPRVRPLRQERNGGQSAARNRGLDEARAPFVKFLDSDDLLTAHLHAEVAALEQSRAEIAASGWTDRMADGTTRDWDAPVFHSVVDEILAGRAAPTSAALYVRRPDWRWDPSLRKLDDWDYFCQAALGAAGIVTVPGSAYVMREHGEARATDATMLANAREHHAILRKIEQRLAAEGLLTPARRQRLAQYFYKELRVLSLHDDAAFDAAIHHIFELDPSFTPRDEERQPAMRLAARILGVRNAVLLHRAIKRAVKGGARE